ncbi:uncharacterized protein TNCV_372271 [Trichonephila clavipes]|nr:uncharacterized protein TNCV_372271 [Trichonephila clavipes]
MLNNCVMHSHTSPAPGIMVWGGIGYLALPVQPALHLRGVGASCLSLPSGLGDSRTSTGECANTSDTHCPKGCGSPVVKVSDHGRHVMSSSPVPLKTRRVGQRCTLNLSRTETSSRWCGVVVRRGGYQLRCRPCHLTMVQNYVVRRQKPSCS